MNPDERLIVLLARRGDRDAFSQLVDLYDQRLLYFIRKILGEYDGALDVLQAVWLIAYRKLRTLQSLGAFRVWLYRIAHDQAVSELRRRSRQPVLSDDTEAFQTAEAASGLDESSFDNADLVNVALKHLSVDHRRVLTLRFLEDMKVDDIAAVIGCSTGTIKSRLHYARIALKRRIEELCDE